MGAFTLDTSGAVPLRHTSEAGQTFISTLWSDLSPFEQGYVEALFASNAGLYWAGAKRGDDMARGFRHLAPETLAAIRHDCAAWEALVTEFGWINQEGGRRLWHNRNHGWTAYRLMRDQLAETFPPLTPSLGDDGKVYLRETG